MRAVVVTALSLIWIVALSAAPSPAAGETCGEVITIQTHSGTTTRYALAFPRGGAGEPMALVLLVGAAAPGRSRVPLAG